MSLLSGLEKFGLEEMSTEKLFDEEPLHDKKEQAPTDNGESQKEQKQPEKHPETEFLLAKTIRCPVCDQVFRTRMVKTGRVKRLEPDFDLRPRHQYIDTNKYDVSSCPRCGYTAMNRYFDHITKGQIALIRQEVCVKFKSMEPVDINAPLGSLTYEEAIDRYKLALYNTIVKKGHASEKAYECLKLSWLYRGLIEKVSSDGISDSNTIEQAEKSEKEYYEQAYEGFIRAVASENFPMCGMDESTVNILLANMAFKLGKYDTASKLVSTVLTSHAASSAAKNRAMDLKEEIVKKLHQGK